MLNFEFMELEIRNPEASSKIWIKERFETISNYFQEKI